MRGSLTREIGNMNSPYKKIEIVKQSVTTGSRKLKAHWTVESMEDLFNEMRLQNFFREIDWEEES